MIDLSVLLVDDEEAFVDALARRLGKRGFKQRSHVDLTPIWQYAGHGAASFVVVVDTHTLSGSCPFSSLNFNQTVYRTVSRGALLAVAPVVVS